MTRPVVGLPSSPRPPSKNRSASSASQNPIHVPSAGPSEKRSDYQRHRSVHSIPSESRRSTIPLPGGHTVHRPTTSERLPISSPLIRNQDMTSSRNSPYVERRKTNQPSNTGTSYSSELPSYYWSRAGEVTSAAIAQWRAGIPALANLVDDSEEDDGHLLRVLRSYYLNKARTREELPDWLFDEKERGMMPLRGRIPERFEVDGVTGRLPLPPKDNLYSGSSSNWKKIWSQRRKSNATRRGSVSDSDSEF